jgi:hypothetical protein
MDSVIKRPERKKMFDLTVNTSGGVGGFFSNGIVNPVRDDGAQPLTFNANEVRVAKFILTSAWKLSRITLIDGGVSGNASFGIYSSNGNTRLVYSGLITLTANTASTATFSGVTLFPNEYTFAWTSTATNMSLNSGHLAFNNSNGAGDLFNENTIRVGLAANSAVAGALPTTLGAITAQHQPVPYVYWDQA